MRSYRAYGLVLHSDTQISALPEEPVCFERPDAVIEFGEAPDWVQNAMRLPLEVARPRIGTLDGDDSPFTLLSYGHGEFFELAYGEGARFVVNREATRVWGTCRPPLVGEDLVTYLLGPVMGFILRRRGVLALHASSVRLFDSAVVLCGPSGSGKSTTAAALALRGVPVLAEDISPVIEDRGRLYAEPGYPRVCLWPGAVDMLCGAADALPRLTPTWEKRYLPLHEAGATFEPKKQSLGLVYVLAPHAEEARAPRIENLDLREGLLELVKNTYMNWLLDRSQRAAELDMLSRLVSHVPVRRIVLPANPTGIAALCDVIIQDAEKLLRSRSFTAGAGH